MLRGLLIFLAHLFIVGILGSIVVISSWILGQHNRIALWCVRTWGRGLVRATGARVEVRGLERLEAARPAVVVCNHISDVDIYAVAALTPQPFMIPAKAGLFRIPVLGATMSAMGCVPMERTRSTKDVEMLELMARNFEKKAILVFFPEGTRSKDGRLRRFKKGAFATALRHEVPIVPVAISGAQHVRPPGLFGSRPGPVVMEILEPIPTKGVSYDSRDDLVERAWTSIRDALPPEQWPAEEERDAPPRAATTA